MKRVDEMAAAFPHRNAETMLIVAGGWIGPEDDEAIAAAREWFYKLEPYTGGYYNNIEFEGDATATGNYGPAYKKLAAIKGRYDSRNLFRLNSNIKPAV